MKGLTKEQKAEIKAIRKKNAEVNQWAEKSEKAVILGKPKPPYPPPPDEP
jgi:hypothetical protein